MQNSTDNTKGIRWHLCRVQRSELEIGCNLFLFFRNVFFIQSYISLEIIKGGVRYFFLSFCRFIIPKNDFLTSKKCYQKFKNR